MRKLLLFGHLNIDPHINGTFGLKTALSLEQLKVKIVHSSIFIKRRRSVITLCFAVRSGGSSDEPSSKVILRKG